jgi:predicted O-methyltransferase YrrM
VLWGEKVLDTDASDKETKGIIAFNDFVQNDPRVENLLLPFRDGIMMVRKL